MNWNQVGTVFTKEIRDSLRDRRTLFSMIAFPALIVPGCMLAFAFISAKVVKKAQAEVPTVMIIGEERASPALRESLEHNPKLHVVPATPDYAQQITEKRIRAALEVPENFEAALRGENSVTVKLYTYEGEMKSGFATGELEHLLNEYRDSVVKRNLSDRNLPAALVRPFEIHRQNVAPPEKVGGNMFGGVIPYLLIFLCFMGAMYPAIDLTAGEKERGTMETILCSPVGRLELVLGKFLTVLTISLCTVAISVVAMGVSGLGLLSIVTSAIGPAAKNAPALPMLDPIGVLAVVVMILPLAVLFAAGLFCVSLFAKSHKEAQSYVSPFMILIILPAMAAMLPGVELNAKLALIPILNVSLLSKELVSGTFPLGMMALIFSSSCVYAAIALALAVKMFNRESVLFRS